MTQEMFNQLMGIFNTLSTINVRGEDTIAMANCLITLKNILSNENNNVMMPAVSNGGEK